MLHSFLFISDRQMQTQFVPDAQYRAFNLLLRPNERIWCDQRMFMKNGQNLLMKVDFRHGKRTTFLLKSENMLRAKKNKLRTNWTVKMFSLPYTCLLRSRASQELIYQYQTSFKKALP